MFGTRIEQIFCNAVGTAGQPSLYSKVGDRVISIQGVNFGADVTSKFESVISVDGEVQQTSSDDFTGNHVLLMTLERFVSGEPQLPSWKKRVPTGPP